MRCCRFASRNSIRHQPACAWCGSVCLRRAPRARGDSTASWLTPRQRRSPSWVGGLRQPPARNNMEMGKSPAPPRAELRSEHVSCPIRPAPPERQGRRGNSETRYPQPGSDLARSEPCLIGLDTSLRFGENQNHALLLRRPPWSPHWLKQALAPASFLESPLSRQHSVPINLSKRTDSLVGNRLLHQCQRTEPGIDGLARTNLRFSREVPSRWGRCRPHPSQTRTCRFPASGSSR